MTVLEYYSQRSQDSKKELAILIAQANQLIGDTHNSLNTHSNPMVNMGDIKMLSDHLQPLLANLEKERIRYETLDSVCISLELKKER